ncbi:MAG: NADH-quinone oxidoreductase subunit C [Ardenticatenia bacterium]|nr:NADH-quinone oxidoreductase subunit C [Ardenticatenia bacterium]
MTDVDRTHAAHQPDSPAHQLQAAFPEAVEALHHRLGEATVIVQAKALPEVARWLRDNLQFELCVDVTAVDYWPQEPRFHVVYHVLSISRRQRLRLKVPVAGKRPKVPTVTDVWPGANFYEREVFDMFGITFDGHPNLKRILMPEDWEGHPLRKDVPLGEEPVQFTHNVEEIQRKKPYAKQ